ncbi:hypothetical protein Sjap_003100 [Stephania japonica]|uniref:PDZ domain-containing protein n=1 Tax=Stephania japonica TaxID=461633 RepID=A0AAP0PUR5_9MAGN
MRNLRRLNANSVIRALALASTATAAAVLLNKNRQIYNGSRKSSASISPQLRELLLSFPMPFPASLVQASSSSGYNNHFILSRTGPASIPLPEQRKKVQEKLGMLRNVARDVWVETLLLQRLPQSVLLLSIYLLPKVDVTLQDGRKFEGSVVNADFHSDIAVVKINSKTPLPTARLGSSKMLRPGDWVIAMGCPLFLQNTITAGIVSCVNRKSSDLGLGGTRMEFLQTDCAINEGNSGGPLFNLDGEVIGINTLKILAADGLSFAVPIDSVLKVIEHFNKNGRVVRPWLGLKMLDLNEMVILQLKERDSSFPNVTKGVLVPMVTPGSPADHAGFRPGDVVIEFDGNPVESINEIIELMSDKCGKPLSVVVKRANDVLVTLSVVPEEANPDI